MMTDFFLKRIIEKGDSLWKLFQDDGIKIYNLKINKNFRKENPNPDHLKIGSELMIPSNKKIFGIGLPKTGLTSLTHALNLLGFNIKQYPYDLIELIYKKDVSHPYLKRVNGFTDSPANIIWKELYYAYPESKFILTIRDESWHESMEYHVNLINELYKNTPTQENNASHDFFFYQFGPRVFTKQNLINYDKNLFQLAYEWHKNRIIDFFKNKNNLLIMDFLSCDKPDLPFPHKRKRNL